MTALCRSCQAPLIWVATEATEKRAAKRMPLDADPERPTKALVVEDGNIEFTRTKDGEGNWIVRYVKGGRFRSHFASCPDAPNFRRSR